MITLEEEEQKAQTGCPEAAAPLTHFHLIR